MTPDFSSLRFYNGKCSWKQQKFLKMHPRMGREECLESPGLKFYDDDVMGVQFSLFLKMM